MGIGVKKLLVGLLMLLSVSYACNDIEPIYGYKLGCLTDTSKAYINENNHFYMNDKDNNYILVVNDDKTLKNISIFYELTYSDYHIKARELTKKYGEPLVSDDALFWKNNGVVIHFKYRKKGSILSYSKFD